MKLFTIGFAKKNAEDFFETLKDGGVKKVVDIRLNNTSQLAGFTKGNDLKYFLKEICGIDYEHDIRLAPTKEILDNYKNKNINWQQYEKIFLSLLMSRHTSNEPDFTLNKKYDQACFLCSEPSADKCHRRLVVEYFKNNFKENDIEIVHL